MSSSADSSPAVSPTANSPTAAFSAAAASAAGGTAALEWQCTVCNTNNSAEVERCANTKCKLGSAWLACAPLRRYSLRSSTSPQGSHRSSTSPQSLLRSSSSPQSSLRSSTSLRAVSNASDACSHDNTPCETTPNAQAAARFRPQVAVSRAHLYAAQSAAQLKPNASSPKRSAARSPNRSATPGVSSDNVPLACCHSEPEAPERTEGSAALAAVDAVRARRRADAADAWFAATATVRRVRSRGVAVSRRVARGGVSMQRRRALWQRRTERRCISWRVGARPTVARLRARASS